MLIGVVRYPALGSFFAFGSNFTKGVIHVYGIKTS